uniref:Protein kinase domain-containing protein n=1 Tax=Acrobeloides nanus TaxID=290746 RepID=A0A914EM32_9BILA
MFEVFSCGQIPYPDVNTFEELIEYLKTDRQMVCPQTATNEAYEIMLRCWQANPDSRPSFEELAQQLHMILSGITVSYGYIESKAE